MQKTDHKVSNERLSDNGIQSLAHDGSTFSALEDLVTEVTTHNKPRCEREYIQNYGFDPCSATPCNAPNAEFYEWNEGGVSKEAYLCGSCADALGVF